jgi:hypothetical protein
MVILGATSNVSVEVMLIGGELDENRKNHWCNSVEVVGGESGGWWSRMRSRNRVRQLTFCISPYFSSSKLEGPRRHETDTVLHQYREELGATPVHSFLSF